jgi:molecular chaperone DnaJ
VVIRKAGLSQTGLSLKNAFADFESSLSLYGMRAGLMTESRDLYAILGLKRDASADDIRKTYRKLARSYHPDVNPGNKQAEARFKEISAAYDVLSDPEKRRLYDQFGEAALRGGFDPEKARAYEQWAASRTATGRPFEREIFDFDLGDIFGRRPGGAAPPTMLVGAIDIDLAQAIRGAEVDVGVPTISPCKACAGSGYGTATVRTCADCGGTGRKQAVHGPLRITGTCSACSGTGRVGRPCAACQGAGQIQIEVPIALRVPPGIEDGERVRVPAQRTPAGELANPVALEVRVRPHPHFRRKGLDLYLKLPVTVAEAYRGSSVVVPTPWRTLKARIPARSQSGQTLRLRGHGAEREGHRGDLYVELEVRLPDRDDARFEEAVRAAEDSYSHPVREGVRL